MPIEIMFETHAWTEDNERAPVQRADERGEPARWLPSADPCEQALGLDVDAGINYSATYGSGR